MVLEWPDVPRCSRCSQDVSVLLLVFSEETGRNWSGLDVTAHHWMVLEVSGCL